MSDAQHPEDIAMEHWEDDHPGWLVIVKHPVIVLSPGGKALEEVELKVQHWETGEVVSGIGADVFMAMAMLTHRLSERF